MGRCVKAQIIEFVGECHGFINNRGDQVVGNNATYEDNSIDSKHFISSGERLSALLLQFFEELTREFGFAPNTIATQ